MTEVAHVQRIIPGAPPPAPASKSQKKKRKGGKKGDEDGTDVHVVIPDAHSAALVDTAPDQADVKAGSVADELLTDANHVTSPDSAKPGSPVVEMLNKRIKALSKKITRIHAYSSKPHSELNDDQKKTVVTLPVLEATVKELEEVKKATETLEAEFAKELAREHAEAAAAEKQRVAESLQAAQKAHAVRASQIFDVIRLRSLLSTSDPSTHHLNLLEQEVQAIYAAEEILLGSHDSKNDIVTGFLLGEGELAGVSYVRLLEISEAHLNPPPPAEEPVAEEQEEVVETAVTEPEEEQQPAPEDVVLGLPPTVSATKMVSALSFMQESELDQAQEEIHFEDGAEWVEKHDAPKAEEAPVATEQDPFAGVNGTHAVHTHHEAEPVPVQQAPSKGSAIDWADDEGGLPSVDDLQANFGNSGSATPNGVHAEPAPPAQEATHSEAPAPTEQAASASPVDGGAPANRGPIVDEDGFVQARGGRGRSRGGRGYGFRGGERGGFRGGERGGFRGGDRGGPRGGFRGGERGFRGSGNWRGGSDGEGRGRGRGGRGRGLGDRGGAPRGVRLEGASAE